MNGLEPAVILPIASPAARTRDPGTVFDAACTTGSIDRSTAGIPVVFEYSFLAGALSILLCLPASAYLLS